jgi:hypothetical protein
MDIYQTLSNKDVPNLDEIARQVAADGEALKQALEGVVSKEEDFRYNCFKVLLWIAENKPQALYPQWETFVELLDSQNAFHRAAGVQIISALAHADAEKRFEALFDEYFEMFDDPKVMVTRYLVQNVPKVVEAKPHLRERITERLLSLDKTHHTQSRKDLIAADVIAAFEAFYEDSQEKGKIMVFVKAQMDSSSPKARKAAKDFLEAHGE